MEHDLWNIFNIFMFMKKYNEENLQHECWIFARNNYGLKHHKPRIEFVCIPNELSRGNAKARMMGIRQGASDAFLILPNKVVFIEFKTPIGKQSANQIDFEQSVKDKGHEYHIVRTVEQFKTLCENLLSEDLKETEKNGC